MSQINRHREIIKEETKLSDLADKIYNEQESRKKITKIISDLEDILLNKVDFYKPNPFLTVSVAIETVSSSETLIYTMLTPETIELIVRNLRQMKFDKGQELESLNNSIFEDAFYKNSIANHSENQAVILKSGNRRRQKQIFARRKRKKK